MTAFAELQRGAQVQVPWALVRPGTPPPGDATVPGIVLDAQVIAPGVPGGLASLELAVQIPGERQTQRVLLQEAGGNAAQFDLTVTRAAPVDEDLWSGYR